MRHLECFKWQHAGLPARSGTLQSPTKWFPKLSPLFLPWILCTSGSSDRDESETVSATRILLYAWVIIVLSPDIEPKGENAREYLLKVHTNA